MACGSAKRNVLMKRLLEQDKQAEAEARWQGAGRSWMVEPSTLGAKRYALHAHCSFARLSEAELAGAVRLRCSAVFCHATEQSGTLALWSLIWMVLKKEKETIVVKRTGYCQVKRTNAF